ncbi:MAG: helix-turn-helix domain-containing protein [Candidatus Rokuibacteriota bacterium]
MSRAAPPLTVIEAGHALGISPSTIWRMIRRGELPSVRRGGRRLVPGSALRAKPAKAGTREIAPLRKDHPIFRLVGAGRSGGNAPGARDKHGILHR